MSIFSGVIPTVKVSKNSKLNAAAGGLLNNLATSTVSVAVNATLGAQVTGALGLNPNAGSNFLGSVITPGIISAGVGALNQTIVSSITNSKSLGPFGPLVGNLAQAGLSALTGSITQGLFGGGGGSSSPSTYFPGAGGAGENSADFGQGGKAYASGKGGADVVFTISSSISAAKAEAAGAAGAGGSEGGSGWKFICAPEDISWETSAQVDRVGIFGANYAPVQAGTRGMRELNINGAIVEGFCRNIQVEDKVKLLEDLMKMKISEGNRYLQIPVYKVTANSKKYGEGYGEGGHYIIKSIKVQEKMRDLQGNTTRAIVDVSLTQVPAYQVESGRDIASPAVAGAKGPFDKISSSVTAQAKQAVVQAAQAGAASRAAAPGSPAAQSARTATSTATPAP